MNPEDFKDIIYFNPHEFKCNCGKCDLDFRHIDKSIVKIADEIRREFAAPLLVNSSIRCPEYNTQVRGGKNSYHIAIGGRGEDVRLKGRAMDIVPMNGQLELLHKIANRINAMGGLGYYPKRNFLHIDTGPKARWINDRVQ